MLTASAAHPSSIAFETHTLPSIGERPQPYEHDFGSTTSPTSAQGLPGISNSSTYGQATRGQGAMDNSAFAHHRGKSSLSSAGSGARQNVGYSNVPTMISPPFQASRYAGNGYAAPPHNGGNVAVNGGLPNASGSTMPYGQSQPPSMQVNGMMGGGGASSGSSRGSGINNGGGATGSGARARPRRPDTEEIKRVARVHYEELFKFLRSHLAKGQRGPRTNAREKLTRLSQQQFTELSTDVYDELMRRITNARTGTETPHLAVREEFHPKRNQARQKLATLPRTRFKDLSSDVFFELERRFPDLREEFRPEVSEREQQEEEEAAQRQRQRQNSILSSRDEDFGSTTVMPSHERSDGDEGAPQPSLSDVVIPAKSTLVEEQIAVPYTHQDGTDADVNEPNSSYEKETRTSTEEQAASIRDSVVTNDQDNNRSTMYSQASSVGTGFFNGYAGSRATESVASPSMARSSQADGFQSYEVEKLKSDYEFRIATLQQKVALLETQNAELARDNREGLEALQDELATTRKSHESHVRTLQSSIEEHRQMHDAKEAQLKENSTILTELQDRNRILEERAHGSDKVDDEELERLRRDCAEQEELVGELRGEVADLVDELRQLSKRNDEILGDKDTDQAIIRDLNSQVASYRRKYENAKTELRNLKATSQLFVQPPKTDDFMPPSETGAIADVNLTAFQSSIDDLLAAARSKTPSNVLLAMKTVVLAATLITDDVTKFEQRESRPEISISKEQLGQVKGRISNTLNNLMTACRNHASSHGLSPVSLLDAAASHVSASIVDLVKLVKVRKASKEEAEEFEATFTQNGTLPNGLKPLLGSGNLANSVRSDGAFGSPSGDFRRRTGDEDGRLLSTPGGSVGGGGGGGGGDTVSGSAASRSFSPRLRQGTSTMGRYSPVSYRGDITRKNSTGEGSWKTNGDRSRNASVSSSSSQLQQASIDRAAPAVPAINSAILRATSNRSASTSTAPRSPGGANGVGSAMPHGSSISSGLQVSIDEDLVGSKSITSSSEIGDRNMDPSATRTPGTLSPAPQNALVATPPPPLPPLGADESSEAYWAELRNYIEVQTEAIVHCIQALLSSIREGAQGNQLHENLTQITTIVSSIIAISKDNIPRAVAAAAKHAAAVAVTNGGTESVSASRAATASADGERILRELSEHCEKLIEMQAIGGQFDKTTKSNMASASYGVAKGLKALNGLLNLDEP